MLQPFAADSLHVGSKRPCLARADVLVKCNETVYLAKKMRAFLRWWAVRMGLPLREAFKTVLEFQHELKQT